MREAELEVLYRTINTLIKDDVIRFNYYNSDRELQLIQCLLNETNNTIEISFRYNFSEMIEELKKLKNK